MVSTIVSVFVLLLGAEATLAKNCACGKEQINSRIVGGTIVSGNKYPWMASLQFNGSKDSWSCGGSLINDKYILSAAHCVDKIPESITVWLGSNKKDSGTAFMVTEIIETTPRYNSVKRYNDIVLLKLEKAVEFSKDIAPICLPPNRDMRKFTMLTVAGWGMTKGNGKVSEDLLEVTVPEIPFDRCNFRNKNRLIQSQMCAAEVGKDSCGGDSGGPLMHREKGKLYVVGIVSFGAINCGLSKDSVYTRVTEFLPWIKENTKDAEYCSN